MHMILVLSSAAICCFLFEYAKSRFSSNKAYITFLIWISITREIIYDYSLLPKCSSLLICMISLGQIFLLVDVQDFYSDLALGGQKIINKKALKMTNELVILKMTSELVILKMTSDISVNWSFSENFFSFSELFF